MVHRVLTISAVTAAVAAVMLILAGAVLWYVLGDGPAVFYPRIGPVEFFIGGRAIEIRCHVNLIVIGIAVLVLAGVFMTFSKVLRRRWRRRGFPLDS